MVVVVKNYRRTKVDSFFHLFFLFSAEKAICKIYCAAELILDGTTGRVEQKHEIHLKILNENNNYYKNYKIFINQDGLVGCKKNGK
jgi:hypothetical protein